MALEQSIQAEGCLDPLLVWKDRGVVLDGHTRRDLCIEHKKQVKVREIELPDEKAAVEYILRIQRQRRNLTREAMSYFRGAEYNAVKQRRGGRRPAREAKARFVPLPTTAVRLAEKYGVSDKTIKRDAIFAQVMDKIVADYGDPEVKRKLPGADVKLTQATARLLLRTPAEDRKAVVDRLIDQGELPGPRRPAPPRPRLPKRSPNPSSPASRREGRTTPDPFCSTWRVSWAWRCPRTSLTSNCSCNVWEAYANANFLAASRLTDGRRTSPRLNSLSLLGWQGQSAGGAVSQSWPLVRPPILVSSPKRFTIRLG